MTLVCGTIGFIVVIAVSAFWVWINSCCLGFRGIVDTELPGQEGRD